MQTFSVVYLATCVALADILFPYSAIALALWIVVAASVLAIQKKLSA